VYCTNRGRDERIRSADRGVASELDRSLRATAESWGPIVTPWREPKPPALSMMESCGLPSRRSDSWTPRRPADWIGGFAPLLPIGAIAPVGGQVKVSLANRLIRCPAGEGCALPCPTSATLRRAHWLLPGHGDQRRTQGPVPLQGIHPAARPWANSSLASLSMPNDYFVFV